MIRKIVRKSLFNLRNVFFSKYLDSISQKHVKRNMRGVQVIITSNGWVVTPENLSIYPRVKTIIATINSD